MRRWTTDWARLHDRAGSRGRRIRAWFVPKRTASLPGRADSTESAVELELLRGLRHVLVRQVRVDREVDRRTGALDHGRAAFELGLLLLDRLGQQARVEVEADGGHVAVLRLRATSESFSRRR